MRTGVALALAASLLLAGCSTAEEPDSAPPLEQSTREVRIASGSFTVGSPDTEQEPSVRNIPPSEVPSHLTPGEPFGLADVSMEGGSAAYTFFGDGVVNYVGRYVDHAVTYDSNEPVDVDGTSILQLDLIFSPAPVAGSTKLEPITGSADAPLVSVRAVEPSNGVTQSFLGTSADRPAFTVTPRQDPPGLVVTVL